MNDFGLLPQEWERQNSAQDVLGANGFVKNLTFGADQQLFVRFDLMPEARYVEKIDERGEKISVVKEITKHEYVWIQRPGDKTQVYHQRAKRRHIRRFPKHYEAFKSGKEQGMLGIPLSSWDYQLSTADIHSLRLLGVEYVHQLANINDSTLPVLGLEGKRWRAAAQVTMQEFADKQAKTELQTALNERDEHIRALQEEAIGTKSELEKMREEMFQLTALLAEKAKQDPIEKEVAKINKVKKKETLEEN